MRRLLVTLLCASLSACLLASGAAAHQERQRAALTASAPTRTDAPSALAAEADGHWPALEAAFWTFVQGEQARIDAEAAEAAAEAARAEAERAAAAARPAPAAAASSSSCCGPHSDAWWQGVAVCEQGGRNDPYFGYFSFMDGSEGGKPWAEQVAAGNALLARAGREVGPWAASCVAAGYRSSPGG